MTTLIGTNPDQIPVNSMLGGMAYQDPDNVSVGKITYSGTLLGNGDVVFGGSSPIWTSTGRTSLNVNGTSSSVISLSTASSANTSAYLYWDNLNFDIQNNTVGGWVRIGVKDYPNALIVSSTGNLGLGVTPSAWTTGYKAFEFGYNALASADNATVHLTLNGYYNAGWKYKNNGNSNLYSQINGGGHAWYIAPSGTAGNPITWTTAMTLDASGNLTLSGTGATKLQEGTTAQRPAAPQEGMIRKNSTLGVIEGYSGGDYVSLEAGRLINIFESMTSGVDSTFNLSPKTSYIIVEMIAGGGGGGGFAGSLSNNTVGLGRSGTPGCAVRFIIKPSDLVSTYYYRIGSGGASSATGTGTDGGDTIFSKEPTSGAMTNYLQCGGGIGGTVGAIYTPPVHLQYSSWPGLTIQGTASSWVKLETTEGYTGENILAVSSDYAAFRSRDQLATFNQITSRMDCFYYPGIGYRGVGGGGRESKQTSGGVLTSILNATAGLGGMIRIYEYS